VLFGFSKLISPSEIIINHAQTIHYRHNRTKNIHYIADGRIYRIDGRFEGLSGGCRIERRVDNSLGTGKKGIDGQWLAIKSNLKPPLKKSLANLPKPVIKKMAGLIDELAGNPYPSGHKKLAGSDHTYRIRSGDYRIVYSIFDELRKII
jgi:mRNA interferase RelE/StbE